MRAKMIRGFDYRTRTPLHVPLSHVRAEIAKAREAGLFGRLDGDAVIYRRTEERGFVPAIEYYDQEAAR